MTVTDDEVATLRAYLSGDQDLYHELHGRLDRSATRTTYVGFTTAAFLEAVDRRFAGNGTEADVISFVSDVRSRSDEAAQKIDPQSAERFILAALRNERAPDLDSETRGRLLIVLLGALVWDQQYDDAGLDSFLEAARKRADDWFRRSARTR